MKQLLTLITAFLAFATYGQESQNFGKSFFVTQNYLALSCDATGQNQRYEGFALERNFVIVVEAKTESGYVISVPEFSRSQRANELNARFYGVKGTNAVEDDKGVIISEAVAEERFYFLIPFKDFEDVCESLPTKRSFTIGIPTIPAKVRFGNGGKGEDPRYFRFEGNLSLGLSAGYKRCFGTNNKYAWNLLGGFTIASVAIDSSTTKGFINATTNAASFSPHIGLVLDVKSFQFGLYTGIDFLYGEPNSYWTYRNRPWLGIGVGYSLFNTESEGKNK